MFVHDSESGMNSQKQAERVFIIQLVCESGWTEMKGKGGGKVGSQKKKTQYNHFIGPFIL